MAALAIKNPCISGPVALKITHCIANDRQQERSHDVTYLHGEGTGSGSGSGLGSGSGSSLGPGPGPGSSSGSGSGSGPGMAKMVMIQGRDAGRCGFGTGCNLLRSRIARRFRSPGLCGGGTITKGWM